MTLIFSHMHPVTGLFACSDIVTSVEGPAAPVFLPYRQRPLNHQGRTFSLSGHVQKMFIVGATMVLWAGRISHAQVLARSLLQLSENGSNPVELQPLLRASKLSDAELKKVAFVYHFTDPRDPALLRWDWNCQMYEKGPLVILGAGSGFKPVFIDGPGRVDVGGAPEATAMREELIIKIAAHAAMEAISTHSLDSNYGGWFEIAYRGENTFHPITHATKFWFREGDELHTNEPVFFSWYIDGQLVTSRVLQPRVSGSGLVNAQHFLVPSLLPKGRRPAPPSSVPFAPFFTTHVLFENGKPTLGWVDTTIGSDLLRLRLTDKEADISLHPQLVERMKNLNLDNCNFALNSVL